MTDRKHAVAGLTQADDLRAVSLRRAAFQRGSDQFQRSGPTGLLQILYLEDQFKADLASLHFLSTYHVHAAHELVLINKTNLGLHWAQFDDLQIRLQAMRHRCKRRLLVGGIDQHGAAAAQRRLKLQQLGNRQVLTFPPFLAAAGANQPAQLSIGAAQLRGLRSPAAARLACLLNLNLHADAVAESELRPDSIQHIKGRHDARQLRTAQMNGAVILRPAREYDHEITTGRHTQAGKSGFQLLAHIIPKGAVKVGLPNYADLRTGWRPDLSQKRDSFLIPLKLF